MSGLGEPGSFELEIKNRSDVAEHEFHSGGRHLPHTGRNSKNELFFEWKLRIYKEAYEQQGIALIENQYVELEHYKSYEHFLFQCFLSNYDTKEVIFETKSKLKSKSKA